MAEKKKQEKATKDEKNLAGIFFELNDMEKILDDVMKNLPASDLDPKKPLKLNLSLRLSPTGKINISQSKPTSIGPAKTPLIDILEEQDKTVITAEMHGIEEKHIKVNALGDNSIEIVSLGAKRYYKRVPLNHALGGKAEKTFKNGILELKFWKK